MRARELAVAIVRQFHPELTGADEMQPEFGQAVDAIEALLRANPVKLCFVPRPDCDVHTILASAPERVRIVGIEDSGFWQKVGTV